MLRATRPGQSEGLYEKLGGSGRSVFDAVERNEGSRAFTPLRRIPRVVGGNHEKREGRAGFPSCRGVNRAPPLRGGVPETYDPKGGDMTTHSPTSRSAGLIAAAALCAVALFGAPSAVADETCMSPYMAKIVGQEDFVYVWTLGMAGVGDEQDKLVTVDVNPKSANYGKVVNTLSVGGRNEAHHSGLHRRPPLPVGGRTRYQQDLRLRRRTPIPRSRSCTRRSPISWRRAAASSGRTRSMRCPGAC